VQELLHLRISREKCSGGDQLSCTFLQRVQHIYIKEVNSEEAVICKSRRIELIVPNMQPTDHISTGVE
jgi:hypothetical protein